MALTSAAQAELDGLKAALQALRTGKMPSRVVYQGRETDFAKIELVDVKSRVAQLERAAAGESVGRGLFSSAIRFTVR